MKVGKKEKRMRINKYLDQSGDATVPQGKSQKELCNKPFFNDI